MQLTLKPLLIIILIVSTSACCSVSGKNAQPEAEKKRSHSTRANAQVVLDLKAIVEGDPVKDAEKALSQGDIRLWFVSNKGKRDVPGLENLKQVETHKLELKSAPGMGDTVYGNEHLELRERFIEYAAKYNQIIFNEQ